MSADDLVVSHRDLLERQPWKELANCRGIDARLFYPERGESSREAKAVCRACDVQAECLAYAVNNGEKHGIWGGISEEGRRAICRELGIVDEPPRPRCGSLAAAAWHRRHGEEVCPACLDAAARYQSVMRPSRSRDDVA